MPSEAPTNMEALLLNSTSVYLKWKSPTLPSLNGELQGYKIEIRSNYSENKISALTVGVSPSLLLGNLTAGVTYNIRVAAITRAGIGPFSPPATLRLDPASRVISHSNQRLV